MKITPRDIARSLIDTVLTSPETGEGVCDAALALLRDRCPGVTMRNFVRIMEKEMKRRGTHSAGLLVVPTEHSIAAEHIAPLLSGRSGKKVALDRSMDPDLIGGAVLLVDHSRLDCSVRGALDALLKICLSPLH